MKVIDDFILQYEAKYKEMDEHQKFEMIATFMRNNEIVTTDFLKEINSVDFYLRRSLKYSSSAYWGAFMAGVAIGGLLFTNLMKYSLIPTYIVNIGLIFIAVCSFVLSLKGALRIKRMNVVDDIFKTLKVL